jgi:hypothetical protein
MAGRAAISLGSVFAHSALELKNKKAHTLIGDGNIIGNTVSQGNLIVLGAYSNLTGALNVSGLSNLTGLNVSSTANFLATSIQRVQGVPLFCG